MLAKIRKWYQGEVIPYENEPGSHVVIIGWDEKRHWTAEVAHTLVKFWFAHWQWTIGTALAVVGLLIAALH
jgi:hypothetical protein